MSKKIGLFFGTTTGKTETVAESIQKTFGDIDVELHDISQTEATDFNGYECLIIGSPTWNLGDLQDDWEGFFSELDEMDFSGKTVAYFGTGDQVGYGDTFQDAMGMLEEKISERGGKTIGYTSTDGYNHTGSKAIRDDKFCGLAIDDDSQPHLTKKRINAWVPQVKEEFGV